ncbi:MAG: molybdopterin-dependent oxidoreductase [Gemmatimonadales bacterium]
MRPTRREFLYTMGAAATVYGLQDTQDVFWTRDAGPDVGWTPGLEMWTNSTCLICPGRCGIRCRTVDGKLVRIMGNTLHPMSSGGVCPRGVAGVQMLYHPQRLAGPMVRVGARGGGEWRAISRSGAVSLIVDKLRDLRVSGRPDRLGVVAGYCAGSMQDLLARFLEAYGSPNLIAEAYPDATDAVMNLMHGIRRRPGYDLERSDLVVSFGAPLFEAWTSPVQAFAAFAGRSSRSDSRRPHVVQIDTRFSRTAARSHEWVGIRPGTYHILALGLAYILIRDQMVDADFLSNHVVGFADHADRDGRRVAGFRSLVLRNYRTEEVSRLTGVSIERITALAKAIGSSEAPVILCGPDVTLDRRGLLNGMAVHSLNILLGRVNRPGGVLVASNLPIAPLVPVVLDETARSGGGRDPIGGPQPKFGDGVSGTEFATQVAEHDSIEILLTYYANPLASSTHPEAWRSALSRVPFVVSFSPFMDETSSQADLILPDLLPYERWQDAPTPSSYPYTVWGVTRPVVEPYAGGLHTGDALLRIARELGGTVARSLPYDDFESLLKTRARGLYEARRGMVLGDEFERKQVLQMEERGWWLPEHSDFDDFWNDLVASGGWTDLFYDHVYHARLASTPSGRIQMMPKDLLDELEGDGELIYLSDADNGTTATEEFPLRLLPFRVSTLASGTLALERWLVEQPGIFPDTHWTPWVGVHPETARALGFGDGTMMWVVSARGRYRAQLKVFSGTARENVCAPYGLRHPDGELANPLQILTGETDPLTGIRDWRSTFVRLERT